LPIQLFRSITELADALFETGQLVHATTLPEIRGSNLHAFDDLHELRGSTGHVIEMLPHLGVIRTMVGEIAQHDEESPIVGTQRLEPVSNVPEQRLTLDAATGRRSVRAARTTAPEVGAVHPARTVVRQILHRDGELFYVFQNVAPSAEQPMARSPWLDAIKKQVHGSHSRHNASARVMPGTA
jgi:hypothetical protein